MGRHVQLCAYGGRWRRDGNSLTVKVASDSPLPPPPGAPLLGGVKISSTTTGKATKRKIAAAPPPLSPFFVSPRRARGPSPERPGNASALGPEGGRLMVSDAPPKATADLQVEALGSASLALHNSCRHYAAAQRPASPISFFAVRGEPYQLISNPDRQVGGAGRPRLST